MPDALDQLIEELRNLRGDGLIVGTAGNASVRQGGRLFLSRTGCRLGQANREDFAEIDGEGSLVDGPPPSKEYPLHAALYARDPRHNCVIHLHSTYGFAASCLPTEDPSDVFPPLTPYAVMRLGEVPLLGYHRPGSSTVVSDIEKCPSESRAALLSNHGMVVWGRSPTEVAAATVELEELAHLFILLRGNSPQLLSPADVADLRATFRRP